MDHPDHLARDVMVALGAALESHRPALAALRRVRCAVAVAEGAHFVLDTADPNLVHAGWDDDADLSVVTNTATLSDLARGRFDPGAPAPHHLWVWAGEPGAWERLARGLGGAMSLLSARVAAARSP